ncbi:MAG: transposase [Clostridia bacterium]|nr:transposase [Clostridia bacterium]
MRKNRKKSPEYKYHIRVRGIKEVPLFRDEEDKSKYLALICKYKKIHKCRILSYCIMDTHGHIFIDPRGYDISKFMQKVNLCYSQYYNKKYDRAGPVFRGRFDSDPVCSYSYCLALTAYIHNNPKDIEKYKGREEYFYYSSYGLYAGIRNDELEILYKDYMLGLMLCKDIDKARKKLMHLTKKQNISNSIKNIIECLQTGEMRIFYEQSE